MIRIRIRCRGAVQGVGFRPTVHRLATSLELAGWVANDPEGATVELEGEKAVTDRFLELLADSLPPLARLDSLEVEVIERCSASGFAVVESEHGKRAGALIPPDAALCADCRSDMEDTDDRRHSYPFTTCTNCGPRFSLVLHLPYDRQRTAMGCFPLCAACQAEYDDPGDRRFHAEPVCCPDCGPRLWLTNSSGAQVAEGAAAIERARTALLAGEIVAVKALGGFQLACRADRESPVDRLRARKRRPSKPFAVMVRDLAAARELVRLHPEDEDLLTAARAPIVLAPRRNSSLLAAGVAPDIEDLGVLLPTTPLHVELCRDPDLPPLVMTSGNRSEEPICRGNREVLHHLGAVADLFLLHDRDVVRRVDDSVVRSTSTGPLMVRRARGWVPEPLPLPARARETVLAVGGHLQATACLAVADQAFLSQHVGDLDSEPARAFLREVIDGLEDFLETRAEIVAADLHPDYPSTWLAEELSACRDGRIVRIQHHLAHAAAVLGESMNFPDLGDRALALSLDGTGWGGDGTAWGGEWMAIGGDLRWTRLAHLEPLPLVGGEVAVREPWRVATAALVAAGAGDLLHRLPMTSAVEASRIDEVARLAQRPGWPLATGAGRLFEACGALLGLAVRNSWEGEAAVRLESLAAGSDRVGPWPEPELDEALTLPSAGLLAEAGRRLLDGETPEAVAAGFHATFSRLAVELTERVAGDHRVIALGGGCMVNRLLLRDLDAGLRQSGLEPLLPRQVPPGDGGLAYGQAVLATVAVERGVEPVRVG